MTTSSADQLHIFISYSHKDAEHLKRLKIHLTPYLTEDGDVVDWLWDDTQIQTGSKWFEDIEQALHRIDAAILLISADFLASRFIRENELPPLLEAAEEKGIKVMPVILSPCGFESNKKLSQFQAAHKLSQPLSSLRGSHKREEWWAQVAKNIYEATIFQKAKHSVSFPTQSDMYPSPSQKQQRYRQKIEQARSRLVLNSVQNQSLPKRNYQQEIVTAYDLDSLTGMFMERANYGQASAFIVVMNSYEVLNSYVVRRMQQEFENARQLPTLKKEVILDGLDLINAENFEEHVKDKIVKAFGCRSLIQLPQIYPKQHFLLTIWNYDLTCEVIREALSSFWETVVTTLSSYLAAKNLCFVLILANDLPITEESWQIQNFMPLKIPNISTEHLRNWMRGRLAELQIHQKDIDLCIEQIDLPTADFITISRRMIHIANYLQGKPDDGYTSRVRYNVKGKSYRR